MTQTGPSLDILARLLDLAKRAGAENADAVLLENASLGVSCRLGQMEDLERSEGRDVGLRVLIGRKQAIVSGSDVAPMALELIAQRAVDMARYAPEDPFAGLADPALLAKNWPDNLDMIDNSEPGAEELIEQARATEDAARAVSGITNSEGASASWSRGRIAIATSHGFAGSYENTSFAVGVSVLAGEGTAMERDYEYDSARHRSDLADPADIGRRAAERTIRRLGARSVKPRKVPVVYDPRVSGGLLGHLTGAISGSAVARGTSFLKNSLGEMIFAPGINVIDDPLRPRGQRSKPFDGEGVATRRQNIIDDGRLTTWMLDSASARQLNLASTGHASRGVGLPAPGPTNFYMAPGKVSVKDLIGAIDDGFYVTEMIGMGVNGVTGDYSRGASGFWIEKGELAYPVSGLTLAGNLRDMYKAIIPADDLVFKYGVNAPTMRIDGMTIAGS
ncbi:TldD/PmbA family protein [Emcibacter sp. SYSU 3D8]|uniref:TldD/PmbA family protein n=1 Tax=Emcibacter sp. SYSU 3D8 TaxID=3133969 RepID=UPI0031FEAC74